MNSPKDASSPKLGRQHWEREVQRIDLGERGTQASMDPQSARYGMPRPDRRISGREALPAGRSDHPTLGVSPAVPPALRLAGR